MVPVRLLRWVVPALLGSAPLSLSQVPPAAQPPATQPVPPAATAAEVSPKPPVPIKWPAEVSGRKLSEWIADLSSSRNLDPSLRDAAVKTIPMFGPDGRKLGLAGLCNVIKTDPDPGVRVNAILVVGGMGFETKEEMRQATSAIAEVLKLTINGSMIRLHATRTLASFGPEAATIDVIGGVLTMATDPAWETRQGVAAALGRLGATLYDDKTPAPGKPVEIKRHASKAAMDKLAFTMIRDPSAVVRMEAVQSLLVLGPPHEENPTKYVALVKPYLDAVTLRLKDAKDKGETDNGVRIWLMLINMMYDDRTFDALVPKIGYYINAVEVAVRVHALNALAIIGPRAQGAASEIRSALAQKEPLVIVAAAECLVAMGDAGKYALPDLERLKTETEARLAMKRGLPGTPNEFVEKKAEADDKLLKKAIENAIKIITEAKKPEAKKEEPKKEPGKN